MLLCQETDHRTHTVPLRVRGRLHDEDIGLDNGLWCWKADPRDRVEDFHADADGHCRLLRMMYATTVFHSVGPRATLPFTRMPILRIQNRGKNITTTSGIFGTEIKANVANGEGTVTFSMEDGGKTFVAKASGSRNLIVRRTIENGKMIQKMTTGTATATRVYDRLEDDAAAAAVAASTAAAEKQ